MQFDVLVFSVRGVSQANFSNNQGAFSTIASQCPYNGISVTLKGASSASNRAGVPKLSHFDR